MLFLPARDALVQEHQHLEDEDRSITVRSPRLWASYYDGYMTVPEGAVYRAIDARRSAMLSQPGVLDGLRTRRDDPIARDLLVIAYRLGIEGDSPGPGCSR